MQSRQRIKTKLKLNKNAMGEQKTKEIQIQREQQHQQLQTHTMQEECARQRQDLYYSFTCLSNANTPRLLQGTHALTLAGIPFHSDPYCLNSTTMTIVLCAKCLEYGIVLLRSLNRLYIQSKVKSNGSS